jgi:uncharacterized protein YdeI (YjbR/CyaY-like superfamily)
VDKRRPVDTARRNQLVDDYAAKLTTWRDEFAALRALLLETELLEERKWRKPCYTTGGKNIVIFQPFKELAALLFFQGVLLTDPHHVLREQGEHSQSALRLEFRSLADVRQAETFLGDYVEEAIENARAGRIARRKATAEYPYPEELLVRFGESPRFREAFEALTPGRQRGYLLHFAAAKRSATRAARIERYEDRIFDGLGLHD